MLDRLNPLAKIQARLHPSQNAFRTVLDGAVDGGQGPLRGLLLIAASP